MCRYRKEAHHIMSSSPTWCYSNKKTFYACPSLQKLEEQVERVWATSTQCPAITPTGTIQENQLQYFSSLWGNQVLQFRQMEPFLSDKTDITVKEALEMYNRKFVEDESKTAAVSYGKNVLWLIHLRILSRFWKPASKFSDTNIHPKMLPKSTNYLAYNLSPALQWIVWQSHL